jgi:ABC-type oligopeptide transport system substrate-binding subunit
MGAADGHTRDYGRFLVATGPYQIAGSADLDFSKPAKQQDPLSGYEPGKSIELERNPNYDPSTDGLRPAYPDSIQVTIGGDNNDLYNKIDAGELDFVVDGIVPPEELKKYSTTPERCRAVPVVQPGAAAVRRCQRPQGGELRHRQGRHAPAAWWPAHR